MSADSVSAIYPQLPEAIAVYEHIRGRYIFLGAYTFLLLEHLAFIPEEIEVWKSSWNVAKFFFLIYRYSAVAGLTLIIHMGTGIIDDGLDLLRLHREIKTSCRSIRCKRIVGAAISMVILSMALADALVVLRVSVLWGRQRPVLISLAIALFLSGAAAVTCVIMSAPQVVATTVFIPSLKICDPLIKPQVLFSVWIPGTVFDILVLTLTSYNASYRPRDSRTKLTRAMYRDGIIYFVILSGLRLTNFLISLFSDHYILSVSFTWTVSAATLSRFVFHLRSVEESSSTEPHLSFGSGPEGEGDVEALARVPRLARLSGEELPMRRWPEGHGAETSQSLGSSSGAGRSDILVKR